MRLLGIGALGAVLLGSPATGQVQRPSVANGLVTTAWPEVGWVRSSVGSCSGTLIGCRNVLTAAHCVCAPSGTGAPCGGGNFVIDPTDVYVYLPQGGFLFADEVRVPPTYQFGVASDLALLTLAVPARGVRPRTLNRLVPPPLGTFATIVGFGHDAQDAGTLGIKRMGQVFTQSCIGAGVPGATHVCWLFDQFVGPPGTDSNICSGDSGGPVLADLGAGTAVVGVHSGGPRTCHVGPEWGFATNVFADHAWLEQNAGIDLDATRCGDGPQVGDLDVTTLAMAGLVSTEARHAFVVSAGTKMLRVALNGEVGSTPNDLDLYLGFGSAPTTTSSDCSSAFTGSSEYCEVADPAAGTWHALVDVYQGLPHAYQLTVTLLPENPALPPPAPGRIVVADFFAYELFQIDPEGGDRTIGSSSLRGFGPDLYGPEGIALERDGSLLVANAFGGNLLRIDLATGDRSVVSGCADAACSSQVGTGPDFLSPRFVAVEDGQHVLVSDRLNPDSGGYISALVRVELATGDRSVVSGCSLVSGDSCAQVVGAGPLLDRLFGVEVATSGEIFVADSQAVLRIHPASGAREVLSGCIDPSCSGVVGSGPVSGEPVDLVLDDQGDLFVSYQREGFAFGALRRVDPETGARTQLSGCVDTACAAVTGSGPVFQEPFGIAFDEEGDLLVAEVGLHGVLHVDRETGARTVVSGCQDPACAAAVGEGSQLTYPIDVVGLPETEGPLLGLAALLSIAVLRVAQRLRVVEVGSAPPGGRMVTGDMPRSDGRDTP